MLSDGTFPRHPSSLTSINNLTETPSGQGKHEEAEENVKELQLISEEQRHLPEGQGS